MMSGASQNFLRVRMYAHKSENKSNMMYAVASTGTAYTIHDWPTPRSTPPGADLMERADLFGVATDDEPANP